MHDLVVLHLRRIHEASVGVRVFSPSVHGLIGRVHVGLLIVIVHGVLIHCGSCQSRCARKRRGPREEGKGGREDYMMIS